ncbi:hypothetical protein ATANTOWER_001956 [Ataeniobius toweri]|uniref:Uncharacterized protein n=1 Tax=Ataeniobius toweri TaxID=208326 RepID=A0ABU7B468_9TELE|nr:hypothetical protein [Ataeniobius toweri]
MNLCLSKDMSAAIKPDLTHSCTQACLRMHKQKHVHNYKLSLYLKSLFDAFFPPINCASSKPSLTTQTEHPSSVKRHTDCPPPQASLGSFLLLHRQKHECLLITILKPMMF